MYIHRPAYIINIINQLFTIGVTYFVSIHRDNIKRNAICHKDIDAFYEQFYFNAVALLKNKDLLPFMQRDHLCERYSPQIHRSSWQACAVLSTRCICWQTYTRNMSFGHFYCFSDFSRSGKRTFQINALPNPLGNQLVMLVPQYSEFGHNRHLL